MTDRAEEEGGLMVSVDCPWCEGRARMVDDRVACERCRLVIEIAAEAERPPTATEPAERLAA